MNVLEINCLALAYLGDSIYESYIREYLIKKGISHVKDLQELLTKKVLTSSEIDLIKRARNTKVNSHPKNCDIITYHEATAFEALFGYLKLKNDRERLEEIINQILID